MKDLTIIIPTRNEEKRITKTVKEFANHFKDSKIFIITNNSTDSTEKIADSLAKKYKNVEAFTTAEPGKGIAVYAGMKKTKTKLVGYVDSDLAVKPEEFKKLIPYAKDYQCVIASRWIRGAKILNPEPLKTRIASRVLNILVRLLFGINVNDTQCGAKIFRTSFVKKFINKCYIYKMAFDIELLWRTKKAKGKIKEVPITWKHQEEHSKTQNVFKGSKNVFIDLIRLRMRG